MQISSSIAVRRIVKGDTLSLYFDQQGLPLFQGFDPETGTAVPAWTATEYPVVTPKVGSARSQGVTLTQHIWKYNGTDLAFPMTGSGWVTSSKDARFQMNYEDGSLRVVGNLASKDNQDSDTLTYEGTAVVGSSSYPMSKTIDIQICPVGSSSYGGGIMATTAALDTTTTSTKLTTTLYNANGAVSDYSVKWYKDTDAFKEGKEITVSRDDVDSQQLFIAVFLVDNQEVYRAGITITDTADEYKLDLYHANATQGGDESTKDKIGARIYKVGKSDATQVTPSSASYTWKYYKSTGFEELKTQTTTNNYIEVVDADTKDSEGNTFDITVFCEVEFEV